MAFCTGRPANSPPSSIRGVSPCICAMGPAAVLAARSRLSAREPTGRAIAEEDLKDSARMHGLTLHSPSPTERTNSPSFSSGTSSSISFPTYSRRTVFRIKQGKITHRPPREDFPIRAGRPAAPMSGDDDVRIQNRADGGHQLGGAISSTTANNRRNISSRETPTAFMRAASPKPSLTMPRAFSL